MVKCCKITESSSRCHSWIGSNENSTSNATCVGTLVLFQLVYFKLHIFLWIIYNKIAKTRTLSVPHRCSLSPSLPRSLSPSPSPLPLCLPSSPRVLISQPGLNPDSGPGRRHAELRHRQTKLYHAAAPAILCANPGTRRKPSPQWVPASSTFHERHLLNFFKLKTSRSQSRAAGRARACSRGLQQAELHLLRFGRNNSTWDQKHIFF